MRPFADVCSQIAWSIWSLNRCLRVVRYAIVVASWTGIWHVHVVIIACSVWLWVMPDADNVISWTSEWVSIQMSIMTVNELGFNIFQWCVKHAFLRRCTSLHVVNGLKPPWRLGYKVGWKASLFFQCVSQFLNLHPLIDHELFVDFSEFFALVETVKQLWVIAS